LIVVGSSRIGFAAIERFMDGDGGAHTAALPSEQVLRWVAGVVGGMRVVSIENPSRSTHRPSGTFRVRVEGTSTGATDLILRISVPRWITDGMVITNARALRLAETHGLAGPRLIAADLDGRASGTVATLETFLSGSSGSPPMVSAARLREAGAAIARVSAVVLAPQADLPHRPRPCAADDRAADRRRGGTPTTPLLQQADERVRSHGVPAAASVFLHGDVWGGNMLWEGDRCVALIDWKGAGVGDPGVDLGSLRMQMALQYGQDAPAQVLEGWQRQAGRAPIAVPYWDAVAALNTPTVIHGEWLPGFAGDGSPLDTAAVTERRDAFLRTALDQLPARIS
jgi:aminoglycoside phosphotransferase (APT) family kinase protein